MDRLGRYGQNHPAQLLQDMVEVAAEMAIGLVGANGGGLTCPYPCGPAQWAGRTEPGLGTAEVVTGST
jgi:hypothetical protein